MTISFGVLDLGSPEGGHPDLFRFPRFSSDLFWFALLVCGNAPICSDLSQFVFRYFPICSTLFSEQIRTNQGNLDLFQFVFRYCPTCSTFFSEQIRTNQGNPLLPTPFANPRIFPTIVSNFFYILSNFLKRVIKLPRLKPNAWNDWLTSHR